MKTLEINISDVNTELIDINFLKDFLPEESELIIYGLGKKMKGRGHYEIYIDCKANGEWMMLSTVTNDTLTIDKFWSDINSEEESEEQADAAYNLIRQILISNPTL